MKALMAGSLSGIRILQAPGTKDPSRLPFKDCPGIEADYQSGAEAPHSKGFRHFICLMVETMINAQQGQVPERG